jgi:hypothetical protein
MSPNTQSSETGFVTSFHLATGSWRQTGGEAMKTMQSQYLRPGRLADVLALLQVLAMDEHAHRSDSGLTGELQGPPRSASSWTELAQSHPEFFRVRPEGEHRVSLIARHVAPGGAAGRPPIGADYTSKLLELAVELHDREVRRSQAWQAWLPMLGVVVGGLLTLLGVWLKGLLAGD